MIEQYLIMDIFQILTRHKQIYNFAFCVKTRPEVYSSDSVSVGTIESSGTLWESFGTSWKLFGAIWESFGTIWETPGAIW